MITLDKRSGLPHCTITLWSPDICFSAYTRQESAGWNSQLQGHSAQLVHWGYQLPALAFQQTNWRNRLEGPIAEPRIRLCILTRLEHSSLRCMLYSVLWVLLVLCCHPLQKGLLSTPCLFWLLQYFVGCAGIICLLCPPHCHSLPSECSVWHAECAQQTLAEESDVLGLRTVPGIAWEEKRPCHVRTAQRHALVRNTIRTLHSDAQKQHARWVPGARWLEWSPDWLPSHWTFSSPCCIGLQGNSCPLTCRLGVNVVAGDSQFTIGVLWSFRKDPSEPWRPPALPCQ